MRSDLPTGTVTFLFTDIEGSTRLLHTLGSESYAEALAEHRRSLREAFAAHGGVEIDTQGDALFVAFATAQAAASAARGGQEALTGGPMRVRMGLHTGTPIVAAEGYVGIDVHRGARIAALAHGGQVLLTEATAALLADVTLTDLGHHRLKDFDGPAHLFQLGQDAFPALRTPGAVHLPMPATRFVGRERELFEGVSLVVERDPPILTILGPGGIGKTRFAIELARLLADEADGGTVFVPLAAARDPSVVLGALAERLGAETPDPSSIAASVRGRRTHVVVDNLEQLLPDAAASLASLVDAAPSLRLLVTSREALGVTAETRFDLPPLNADESVALFLERARRVREDVPHTPAIDALCDRLDRLPLALELAAAWTRLLAPEALLRRLSGRLELPGPRGADPRHATLRATIEWSYDLLSDEDQRLFARLAVFNGGCTLAAAEQVCEADLGTLASLIDKSLLRRRFEEDGSDRYWMLETIREFAAARLADDPHELAVRHRSLEFLRSLAEEARLGVADQQAGTIRLEVATRELDNIRGALEWALAHDPVRGLELATALEEFWVIREAVEGSNWFERLLAAAPDSPAVARAGALRAFGGALDIEGEHEVAAPKYRESLALYEAIGNEFEVANLRFRVAANMANRGKLAEATVLVAEVLTEFERLGHRIGLTQALMYLGYAAQLQGDFGEAADYYARSAEIANELDWTWWESSTLANLAEVSRELGRLAQAEGYARRALALGLQLGERRICLFAAAELAAEAAITGDASRAGRIWGAVEAEEEEAGPGGMWRQHRGEYATIVLSVAGKEFERARAHGRLLTLANAAGVE